MVKGYAQRIWGTLERTWGRSRQGKILSLNVDLERFGCQIHCDLVLSWTCFSATVSWPYTSHHLLKAVILIWRLLNTCTYVCSSAGTFWSVRNTLCCGRAVGSRTSKTREVLKASLVWFEKAVGLCFILSSSLIRVSFTSAPSGLMIVDSGWWKVQHSFDDSILCSLCDTTGPR